MIRGLDVDGPIHRRRASKAMDYDGHLKLCKDTKWLDRVKMEEFHAMNNSQGGVVGHTWR